MCLYSLSMVSVTNCYKLGSPKAEMYSLFILEARVQKQYCWVENKLSAGLCSIQRLWKGMCSLPLPASSGSRHSSACGYITPVFKFRHHPNLILLHFPHCLLFYVYVYVKSLYLRDEGHFPGNLMVKTWPSVQAVQVQSCWRAKIPHALWPKEPKHKMEEIL